jgi:hypothetical protein
MQVAHDPNQSGGYHYFLTPVARQVQRHVGSARSTTGSQIPGLCHASSWGPSRATDRHAVP